MKRLLQACLFAAEKHRKDTRKNAEKTPYINHPIEVAEHLATVGKVSDEDILMAALLHDTIEDTETSEEEIAERFGEAVMELVLECTDDKKLEKLERKRLQIVNAPKKSPGAKMIKIADKTCNLRDLIFDPPKDWSTTRKKEYFEWAKKVVAGLLGINEALDACVTSVLQEGLQQLTEAESHPTQ